MATTGRGPSGMTIGEQVRVLMQGTSYGDRGLEETMAAELESRLTEARRDGRPLRVYCGFDPRTSDLHVGHTVPIRKLRSFQELGHHVIFVVGTFTSLIGDPSDKDELRKRLTREEAIGNGRTYAEQGFRILDPALTEVRYNHEWLESVSFEELIGLASNFSLQQFLTRESFRTRWDSGDPVYLHETLYAIMQAYDACMLDADVQIGGSDQLFNIVTASRKLMTALGKRPNVAIILGILPGTDGVQKMSKSLGNHIPILSAPAQMYGKVMSIPDDAMESYFRLVTALGPDEIDRTLAGVRSGARHPRDAKMRLAREIVAVYHGVEAADLAESEFVRVFQAGSIPERIPVFEAVRGVSIVEVMVDSGCAASKSEARRLIEQGGVSLEGEPITDSDYRLDGAGVLRVGKRRFVRVIIGDTR